MYKAKYREILIMCSTQFQRILVCFSSVCLTELILFGLETDQTLSVVIHSYYLCSPAVGQLFRQRSYNQCVLGMFIEIIGNVFRVL